MDLHPFRTGTVSLDDDSRALLKALGTSGSEKDFDAFAQTLVSSLAGELATASGVRQDVPTIDHVEGLPVVSARGAKGNPAAQTHISLCVDYARCGTPASVIASALQELGFSVSRAKKLGELLGAKLQLVRSRLNAAGEYRRNRRGQLLSPYNCRTIHALVLCTHLRYARPQHPQAPPFLG